LSASGAADTTSQSTASFSTLAVVIADFCNKICQNQTHALQQRTRAF
jgi:hypothetical protein